MTGLALELFRSYLSHRKQYVNLNVNSSTLRNLTIDVLQGSLLGPLLFLVYINDLTSLSNLSNFTLFLEWHNCFDKRYYQLLHWPAFFKLFQILRIRAHHSGSFLPADYEYQNHFFLARQDLPKFYVKSLKVVQSGCF